jgi:hypothetical protein
MDASVACHEVRRMFKESLMMGHRLDGLSIFGRVLQDLEPGHDATLDARRG